MVKKITKYAKFVVCCALIVSLVAPSYAALSASDGSAFVTKAEFDSALADFNSRLTTFEAGINSKIDSQVTSYLDRNGIWNGKDQALPNSYGVFYKKAVDAGCIKASGVASLWADKPFIDNVVVESLSKSGLVCVTFSAGLCYVYTSEGLPRWDGNGYIRFIKATGYSACGIYLNHGLYISRKAEGYPRGIDGRNSSGFGTSIVGWVPRQAYGDTAQYFSITEHNVRNSAYAFCSKDDKLCIMSWWTGFCNTSGPWPENTAGSIYNWVDSVSVY